MFKSKWAILLIMLIAFGMVLSACATAAPEVVTEVVEKEVTVVVEKEVEVEREVTVVEEVVVEVEREPEVVAVDRVGAWVDTVVVIEEPSASAAVSRMETGEIDLYAFQVTNPEVAAQIAASPNLDQYRSFGSYSELTFNPSGPEWADGQLNPFSVPAIREAMNWLVDREYIAEELYGGMALARWTAFNNASGDYALLADVIRGLEFEYAYDFERAEEIITAEMEALGATLVNGVWNYNGAPVELNILIRTEDERLAVGDYVANQLEDIGFQTFRDYKTGAEASPIWIQGDPMESGFHIYTGGWITTVVPRNLAGNFAFFYTDMGLAFPLWQAYENTPEFYDIADRLDRSDYSTLEQRAEMMTEALWLAMEDSNRIFLIDRASVTPRLPDISVAADLYGGVSGAWLWPYTLMREGQVGGSVTIAMPSMLPEPWNPLNGSNWIYDMMLIRGTGENAVIPDPYTGLNWPQRLERAEVVIEEGLPVGATLDWVDLTFESEIVVPDDAWADWDAEEQRFLTAAEVYTETQTVNRKSVVYYPDDMFDTVAWHDGSELSVADFVMAMILSFDRAKEASPVYDAATVPAFNSFMAAFRGVRIVSEQPLVIETYSDLFQLDAEMSVTTWWPYYAQGQGAWHTLALGLLAEEKGELAFSSAKAAEVDTEWTSYIAGPSIAILLEQMDEILETGAIPYAPTLGEFVSEAELAERMANLQEWHRTRGHFWVGTGPFYLERAFPVEKTVILRRNLAFPDMADKWLRFAEAAIAEVEVDGPGLVEIGSEAVFDVFVEFQGAPYPMDDIVEVKFLLFDATGELAFSDLAQAVDDGLWEIVLDADMTSQLPEGSNRLEAVVVSRLVALPSFDAVSFVTTP